MTAHTETEILQALRTYCTENFLYMRPDFVLEDDMNLLKAGVLDSMGIMELVGFLDERFGVLPDDSEMTEQNMGSLRAISALVVRRLSAS